MSDYASNRGSPLRPRPKAAATNSATSDVTDSYETSNLFYAGGGAATTTTDALPTRRSWICCGGNNSASSNCLRGGVCGCYIQEESRPKWLTLCYNGTKSIPWLVVHFCFSILLMFGPAIQSLADVGSRGDAVFLYLRLCLMAFFLADMVVRCFAEEDYFVLGLCGSCGRHGNATEGGVGDSNKTDPTQCSIGSFLFWCDFLSTISILYDLSFVNNHHFDSVVYEINVEGGIPEMGGSYQYNRLSPNSLEANLIVVILRTARCARLVQSRAAVDASSRFRLYGVLHRLRSLNPFSRWSRRQPSGEASISGKSGLTHESLVVDKARRPKPPPVLNVMAEVPADVEHDSVEGRHLAKQFSQGLFKKVKSTLAIESEEELLARRSDAAIKIQRVWRSRVKCEPEDDDWELTLDNDQLAAVEESKDNSDLKESILASFAEKLNIMDDSVEMAPKSRFQSRAGKAHNDSQVGSDMRQLTGKRVAIGTLAILISTVLCTYTESTTTQIKTMVVLHAQTNTTQSVNIDRSLRAAVSSSAPTLYEYQTALEASTYYPNPYLNGTNLTPRNIVRISITDTDGSGSSTSIGLFDNSKSVRYEGIVDIIATIFIILFWLAGVISFTGPVVTLVITPVEQMVRLLGMLTLDPLGYQSTPGFKKFLLDEDEISNNTGWSKELLKGMETSFLKSTILRIGSLMKVGFGSAGVQIIQNNLETGQTQNMFTLNSQGTTVSCIFLFCDIRQFTDATEQLQEEVFVFTNRIAAVVHSICNSYGGAANKNVGDAFLVSWSLDDKRNGTLKAKSNQADKALISVIKICISLAYDNFFLEPLSSAAIGRLRTKYKDRTGSVVQMGFGLHAGHAVQGAIGSQRKIDAAYVAESVERAEFLESSTKKYGLKMLMSGEFHGLLNVRNRDRCRKIDQILMLGHDGHFDGRGEFMDLFTYDMDVDALQQSSATRNANKNGTLPNTGRKKRQNIRNRRKRLSINAGDVVGGGANRNEFSNPSASCDAPNMGSFSENSNDQEFHTGINDNNNSNKLVLPNGPALYSQNAWSAADMKKIRQKYVQDPSFFENYKLGLEAFYNKEWDDAKKCFGNILENFDDGPSKYFLKQIKEHNGVPPEGFMGYGIAE